MKSVEIAHFVLFYSARQNIERAAGEIGTNLHKFIEVLLCELFEDGAQCQLMRRLLVWAVRFGNWRSLSELRILQQGTLKSLRWIKPK